MGHTTASFGALWTAFARAGTVEQIGGDAGLGASPGRLLTVTDVGAWRTQLSADEDAYRREGVNRRSAPYQLAALNHTRGCRQRVSHASCRAGAIV
jgi:hypothetical protein